jgi:hypothetical protein
MSSSSHLNANVRGLFKVLGFVAAFGLLLVLAVSRAPINWACLVSAPMTSIPSATVLNINGGDDAGDLHVAELGESPSGKARAKAGEVERSACDEQDSRIAALEQRLAQSRGRNRTRKGAYHVISFGSSKHYAQSASKLLESVRRKASVPIVTRIYNFSDIAPEYMKQYEAIFQQPRGAGYWIWKPYLIEKHMQEHMEDGDVLLYIDSEYTAMKDLTKLLHDDHDHACWSRKAGEIMYHETPYTKHDAYVLVGVHPEPKKIQVWAGFVIFRKTSKNQYLISEWQRYCTDARVVTDMPSTLGKENPAFVQHRHDQAVLSLLLRKMGMPLTYLNENILLNVRTKQS